MSLNNYSISRSIEIKLRRLRGYLSILLIILLVGTLSSAGQAQTLTRDELPSPGGAFLRSLAVPGWGHYYTNSDDWNRGKWHLAGDVVMALSYIGLRSRANYLENDYRTLAQSKAGTSLSNKSREYVIAVGNYDNLMEYNDAQLRTRNWDQVFPNNAEFQWDWQNNEYRTQYQDTREKVERSRSQLPTLVTLMVVNRLLSGLNAFVRARDQWKAAPEAHLSYLNEFGEPGVTARIRIHF